MNIKNMEIQINKVHGGIGQIVSIFTQKMHLLFRWENKINLQGPFFQVSYTKLNSENESRVVKNAILLFYFKSYLKL